MEFSSVRNYLTFEELKCKWKCNDTDICYAIICGSLKPCIILNGYHKPISWEKDYLPKFGKIQEDDCNEIGTSSKDWIINRDSNLFNAIADEILLKDWLYLQDPVQTAPFDCTFEVASNDRDPDKSDCPSSLWFELPDAWTMPEIISSSVFLDNEIEMYEKNHPAIIFESNNQNKPINPKEKNGLLNIISALCKIILDHSRKPKNQSELIGMITDKYSKKQGISKSNLENKFSEANKFFDTDSHE